MHNKTVIAVDQSLLQTTSGLYDLRSHKEAAEKKSDFRTL